MAIEVGRLVEVPLREIWAHEAGHFTPWLADHVEYLADVLGMRLETVGTEMPVGPFAVDIVLRDLDTGRHVVVENFLETNDHGHLGQLITYAAGLDASCAVLVAKDFKPDHRSALEWLNRISTPETRFFGVQVKAVRIGESLPAALFELVVQPDEIQREATETARQLSPSAERNREWWSEFLQALNHAYPGWSSATTPTKSSSFNLPTGRAGIQYGVALGWMPGRGYHVRVEVYIHQGEAYFPLLRAHQAEIDAALGGDVVWDALDDYSASRIAVYLADTEPDDRSK